MVKLNLDRILADDLSSHVCGMLTVWSGLDTGTWQAADGVVCERYYSIRVEADSIMEAVTRLKNMLQSQMPEARWQRLTGPMNHAQAMLSEMEHGRGY